MTNGKPNHMILVYKLTGYILLIFFGPFLPLIWLFSRKRRANLLQRFGLNTGIEPGRSGKKTIWVHALSVGEVVSSVPFIKALKKKSPSTEIVFTASTKTGFDIARQLFQDPEHTVPEDTLIDQLAYFPFDIGFCIDKICSRIQPDAVVIIETDLWPNFLYEMKKKQIPVILINARLSERSLKGYLFFRAFSALMFSSLTAIMVQSDMDKQRFEQLGIRKDKIQVTGNIKFDQAPSELDSSDIQNIRAKLFLGPESIVFIAGSTHEGEEKILLSVYKKIKKKFSDLVLIIVPRDIGRAKEIESCCGSFNLSVVRMSKMASSCESFKKTDIIVVDKMGELTKLYAVCDVAFIGGSLVPQGGHNPLEAAAVSKPVLFGPDMSDFVMISNLLMDHGGARQTADEKQLFDALEDLLGNDSLSKQMGEQNFKIFCEHSGAVKRILTQMENLDIV